MLDVTWQSPTCFTLADRSGALLASLEPAEAPGRLATEAFIRTRFALEHGAHIAHFLPLLLSLRDAAGALQAAAGIRLALDQPLFLERYLPRPVEHHLATALGQPIDRTEVVEVGNLATLCAGQARLLIIVTTWLLARSGLRWVTFTGATRLINSFHRLGLAPQVLGAADPACLGAERESWSSYYANAPQVCAGDIRQGYHQLLQAGIFVRLGLPTLGEEDCHVA
ncbi:hypothetical protein APT59_01015 [Pseudomonas oryzihabitans]|uniref:Thermostable hemolysin n=1 Tax=Pseudomonas oryzihabitans TaxID=47885 RepID=A0A0U4WUN7_9PSED|nr:thermostable hemolysin [Pseudomonas oryzihabitans]ALZ82852.1 hypothetical protein APT59_01015 [Pseudomonas oryzihabitans]